MNRLASRCLLGVLLVGCTGENVDEAFLATHGAVLARVDCLWEGSPPFYRYQAIMFLDGSVQAQATIGSSVEFYERGNPARTRGQVNIEIAGQTVCARKHERILYQENGELVLEKCEGNPGTSNVQHVIDVDTECSGFNKHLFD